MDKVNRDRLITKAYLHVHEEGTSVRPRSVESFELGGVFGFNLGEEAGVEKVVKMLLSEEAKNIFESYPQRAGLLREVAIWIKYKLTES